MPYKEFVGWQEFYAIEPFGLAVQDALHAHGVCMVAETNRDRKARETPFSLKEFLLYAEPAKPVPETLVDGKTAAQWKLLFAAEALAARKKK